MRQSGPWHNLDFGVDENQKAMEGSKGVVFQADFESANENLIGAQLGMFFCVLLLVHVTVQAVSGRSGIEVLIRTAVIMLLPLGFIDP